jgi:hypothetical protein
VGGKELAGFEGKDLGEGVGDEGMHTPWRDELLRRLL